MEKEALAVLSPALLDPTRTTNQNMKKEKDRPYALKQKNCII